MTNIDNIRSYFTTTHTTVLKRSWLGSLLERSKLGQWTKKKVSSPSHFTCLSLASLWPAFAREPDGTHARTSSVPIFYVFEKRYLCYLYSLYSKSVSFHEVSIDCTCDHSFMALLMIEAIQITCDPECFLLWRGSLGSQPNHRPCGIVDEVEVQTSCLDRDFQLHNAVWGDLIASCWPSLRFPFTAKSVKDFLWKRQESWLDLFESFWFVVVAWESSGQTRNHRQDFDTPERSQLPWTCMTNWECSKLRPLPTSPQPSQEPRDLKGSQPWLLHVHMAVPGGSVFFQREHLWTPQNHIQHTKLKMLNICFHGVLLVTARLESLRTRCRG